MKKCVRSFIEVRILCLIMFSLYLYVAMQQIFYGDNCYNTRASKSRLNQRNAFNSFFGGKSAAFPNIFQQ